jgi:hypothetical protein
MPNTIWHQNNASLIDPFLDIHVIAHFPLDTITYEEPTIPPFSQIAPRIKPHTLHIYCIHHKNTTIGTQEQLLKLHNILHTFNIQQVQIQNGGGPLIQIKFGTPSYNPCQPPPLHPISLHTTPPLADYHTNFPLKFLPQHSFYIDGSFKPPKVKEDGTIRAEKVGHGIFNLGKNLTISKQLLGLQNILKAKLMAIHHAL